MRRACGCAGSTAGDVDALFAIFSDPRHDALLVDRPPMKERAEAEALLARIHRQFARQVRLPVGRRAQGGRRAARHLHAVQHRRRQHARGARLLPAQRATGARATCGRRSTALIDHAFGRAEAAPARGRRRSATTRTRCGSSDKLGFQREGLLRERWNVGGEIQDSGVPRPAGARVAGGPAHERDHGRSVPSRSTRPTSAGSTSTGSSACSRSRRPTSRCSTIPSGAIIAPGGMIFFALEGDAVVGTVAMIRVDGRPLRAREDGGRDDAPAARHRRAARRRLHDLGARSSGYRTRVPRDQQHARQRDPALRAARIPPCALAASLRLRARRRLHGIEGRTGQEAEQHAQEQARGIHHRLQDRRPARRGALLVRGARHGDRDPAGPGRRHAT